MSSKKYIPTVDPLFAVILQAYKKVKVGKDVPDHEIFRFFQKRNRGR